MKNKEDNGYEALGNFVVIFSHLTYTLWLCIRKLVEKDTSLLKIINDDAKIKKIAKDKWYHISDSEIKDLSNSLRNLLTTWEICKIFKSLFSYKYCGNVSFLKIIDVIFKRVDKFCNLDGLRNDFMHSWLFIDKNKPWDIIVDRKTLRDWKLITKEIKLNLNDLNGELLELTKDIYDLWKILHFDIDIFKYMALENWKLKYLPNAQKFIQKKIRI